MDMTGLGQVASVVVPFMGFVGWLLSQQLNLMESRLKEKFTEWRQEDKEEMRTWINGSFLRAPVVEAKLEGFEQRVGLLEDRHGRPR